MSVLNQTCMLLPYKNYVGMHITGDVQHIWSYPHVNLHCRNVNHNINEDNPWIQTIKRYLQTNVSTCVQGLPHFGHLRWPPPPLPPCFPSFSPVLTSFPVSPPSTWPSDPPGGSFFSSHHALPTCTCCRLSARRASCGVRMGRGLDTLWWRNEPEKCKTGQIFIILLDGLSKWRQLESNWAMHIIDGKLHWLMFLILSKNCWQGHL